MVVMAPAVASAMMVFGNGGAAVLMGASIRRGLCGEGGEETFQFAAAVRAGRGGLVHATMKILMRLSALRATIFVDWHSCFLLF